MSHDIPQLPSCTHHHLSCTMSPPNLTAAASSESPFTTLQPAQLHPASNRLSRLHKMCFASRHIFLCASRHNSSVMSTKILQRSRHNSSIDLHKILQRSRHNSSINLHKIVHWSPQPRASLCAQNCVYSLRYLHLLCACTVVVK